MVRIELANLTPAVRHLIPVADGNADHGAV